VKDDLPACFAAVGNVQILPGVVRSVQLVNAFQSALRTQFQRACFQHFIKVLFLKAVPVRALGKDDHYELCIAYARVERTSQDWVALAGRAASGVRLSNARQRGRTSQDVPTCQLDRDTRQAEQDLSKVVERRLSSAIL
jgi:hypothetical protein